MVKLGCDQSCPPLFNPSFTFFKRYRQARCLMSRPWQYFCWRGASITPNQTVWIGWSIVSGPHFWPDKSGETSRLSTVCSRLCLAFLLSIYVCMKGLIGQACGWLAVEALAFRRWHQPLLGQAQLRPCLGLSLQCLWHYTVLCMRRNTCITNSILYSVCWCLQIFWNAR